MANERDLLEEDQDTTGAPPVAKEGAKGKKKEKDIAAQLRIKEAENERLKAELFDFKRQKEKDDNIAKYRKEEGVRKPGISVVDEEGHTITKKKPNSLGISDLMMPPYTKKQIAIYRVVGHDTINPATNEPALPVDVSIPGRYTLFDRFESDPLKKNKIIANITGSERYNEDGKEKVRDVIEDVLLANGYLAVAVEQQFQLYVFMELHPNNKNNKWRPRNNTPVIFERVDIQHKSDAAKAAETDLGVDAALIIREMTKEDLYRYAAPAGITTGNNRFISEIRADLTRWAMKDPIAFFKLKKDNKSAIRIMLLDAINLGLLEYRSDKKSYYLSTTEDIFHTHTVGEESMESMIKAMLKEENAGRLKVLTDQINFWHND